MICSEPATFLDIGGGASEQIINQALNIVLNYDPVKVVFLNVLGGITKADDVARETVRALRKTFITPLDRDDIHRLISRMDDIIDLIEDSAQAVSLYNIEVITPEAFRLAELCQISCEKLKEAISMLDNMKHAQRILVLCGQVDQLETENDHVTYEAMSNLFRNEPDVRTLIKLKALYELLENVCDICEEVGNIVEGIVIENA